MKSIVAEASSIEKAVYKAWCQAKKPKEFTVKVLEKPVKNFFGFTTKSAKLALFFEEKKEMHRRPARRERFSKRPQKQEQGKPERKRQDLWSDDMVKLAQNWVQDSLAAMDLPHVKFTTDVNKFYLKFYFEQPVHESEEKERSIFRSFALLLMQTLRNKYKRPFKGFKVVLTRA